MKELNLTYPISRYDKYFIKRLPKTVTVLSKDEAEEARLNFLAIFNEESNAIADVESQRFHIMCSYVVALHDALKKKGYSNNEIIEVLSDSIKKSAGGNYVVWFTRVMLWFKRNKRKFIEESSIQSKGAYGTFLKMSEEKEKDKFTSIVHACGFNDFFVRRKVPHLTRVFCNWDELWANEVNKKKCGIQFRRTSTIAEGDSSCNFEFTFSE